MFGLDATRTTTTRLLNCGLVGAPLFMTVALVEGATRPGYNPWGHHISQLSLSDQGWLQIANFLAAGLLTLSFAVGLKRALPSGSKGSTWSSILIGVFGLGLVLSGIFVIDPSNGYPAGAPAETTLHGTLHTIFGAGVFASLPAACFVLSRRWTDGTRGKLWVAYSILTGMLMLAFFVASWDGPLAGLYQRVSIGLGWTWIVVLAVRLRASLDIPVAQAVHPVRSEALA